MIYVCSDIHGNYERYEAAKALLRDNGEDVLYIVGDMIDRGPDGLKILLDVMHQDYIVAMLGNHEWMMYQALVMGDEDEFACWTFPNNGGSVTAQAFGKLDNADQNRILRFLSNLPVAVQIDHNGKKVYLVHGCAVRECMDQDILKHTDTDPLVVDAMVWNSPMTAPSLIPDYCEYGTSDLYIHGHKFVQRQQKNYIPICYKDEECEILFIDGGCAIRNPEQYGMETALNVYCIDTDEFTYITV